MILHVFVPLAVAAAIFLSSFGYGCLLFGRGRLSFLLAMAGGLWLLGTGTFLLSLAGLAERTVFLALLLPGLAALFLPCCRGYLSLPRQDLPAEPRLPATGGRLALGLAVLLALLALGQALLPPVARDSLLYHLALPKLYLAEHRWLDVPQNICSYYPGLVTALYLLAMGLGSGAVAVVHWGFGILTVLAAMEIGRLLGMSRASRRLTAAALLATPLFWAEMTWAYADLATACYWSMAMVALLEWRATGKRSWLVALGLMVGAANGCKYTSLFLLLLLPLALFIEARNRREEPGRQLAVDLAIVLGVAVLAAAPWWVKNAIQTGNPLFPFFYTLFPSHSPGWDGERAALYGVMLDWYGGSGKGILAYLVAPFRVFWAGRFDDPAFYDGQPGLYYLLAWLLLPALPNWPWRLRYILGLILCYSILWTTGSQQARYLVVLLPLMAVVAGYGLEAAMARSPRAALLAGGVVLAALGLNLAATLGYCRENFRPACLVDPSRREIYLARRLSYFEIYRQINATLPGQATLLLVMTGNHGYYLERRYFSDTIFESHTMDSILKRAPSAAEAVAVCRSRGWSHLLLRADFFLRPSDPAFALRRRLVAHLVKEQRLIRASGPYLLFRLGPAGAG
ncbi:MAG: hypothetical protein OEV91_05305 [Desulfobulbaceae bacterium]|nr:hypothetical protein [Desulfobulbaceae bacterium]